MKKQRPGLLILALTTLVVPLALCAQERDDEPVDRKERLAEMKRQAALYKVTLSGRSNKELALHEEPLLRFDNPVGGVPDGIIVMWKDGSRPAILAQVFQTAEGLWIHECQSLAESGLQMELEGAVKWSPAKAAGNFRPLASAAEPADSPARRLPQMKKIAGQFTATDEFKVKLGDVETERSELRLLPTPIYRYSDESAGVTDGAVFAFVHGTDPEVFLVLEARSEKGKSAWHYALAPMTCWAVEAKHAGKQVWNMPERLKSKPNEDYHVWVYRPEVARPQSGRN